VIFGTLRPLGDFNTDICTRQFILCARFGGRVLLGHTNGDITTHYSAVELAELITAVNKIDRSLATPAITLLKGGCVKKSRSKK
jgi:hypothetical protein